MKNKPTRTASILREMAERGLFEKQPERLAMAEILERVTRMESRLEDFLNRADVLLSQTTARK